MVDKNQTGTFLERLEFQADEREMTVGLGGDENSEIMREAQTILKDAIAFLALHITGEDPQALPAEEAMKQLYKRLNK